MVAAEVGEYNIFIFRNLREAETQIENLSTDLNSVDERVSALKEQLNIYTKQATEVEINLNGVQSTINKAENLVNKLSKEFVRWHENVCFYIKHIHI